ncbi:MAG: acetylglutamate kinase [Candidatus Lokiarchaeota archaeon]|nr:acetylglutamate kinase [Candidatus Lokiarchaeota archaeon]
MKRVLKLRNVDKVEIIKLGGSLITNKNKPFSLKKDIIRKAINKIISGNEHTILIHGGGSYGHPIAKKFEIFDGYNPNVKNQLLGLSKTHQAMNQLNSFIIKEFINRDHPVISVQPSSIFLKDGDEIIVHSIEILEFLLELNILPVLYGDIILDKQNSFSIISGDRICLEICKKLKYNISKVVFAMDREGIYVKGEHKDEPIILSDLKLEDLENIHLMKLGEKIDVTGGIEGKIEEIKEILRLKIPVQVGSFL